MKIRDSFPQVYYKSEQETLGVATIAMICSTLASSRPSGAGGAEGASPPPSQSFLPICPFFLMSYLNVLFLKEVTQNTHENQQAKSRAN